MILDQADRDVAVSDLLKKVSDVYTFISELQDETLTSIPFVQALYGRTARQTLECAHFIVHYSETKIFCESIPLRRGLRRVNVIYLRRDKTREARFRRNGYRDKEL
jgi:hypothetical protein